MCILLDEIEGGVSTGQEGGKCAFKDKITCVIMRMSNKDRINPISLKCTTSKR